MSSSKHRSSCIDETILPQIFISTLTSVDLIAIAVTMGAAKKVAKAVESATATAASALAGDGPRVMYW